MTRFARRVLLALLAVFALPALGQAQVHEIGPATVRYYYTGTIGDVPVQVDLRISGERVSGSLYYDRVGIPLALSGTMLAYNEMAVDERDAQGVRTGSFQATLSHAYTAIGTTLAGTWTSPDGGRTMPMSLVKAAEYVTVQTRQGERLEVTSHYPVFFSPSWRELNPRVQEDALLEHLPFAREGQEVNLSGELFGGWWMQDLHELLYYSSELVSLLITTSTYTGGAHPNTRYAAANFRLEGDGIRSLGLGDLFLPGSSYLAALSDYVMTELRAREADWVMSGDITGFSEADLRVFTLSPRGIDFAFAPYEVGSYAQGPQFVTVPFGELRDLIDPLGPLGRFLR